MHKQYEQADLLKLQQVELEIYKDVERVCEKYNLGISVIFGSAIGMVRHKGFIPWDDDMDVAMLREDYNKFEKIFDKELGEKYLLMRPTLDKRFASNVIKVEKKGTRFINKHTKHMKCEQGIFIDIFLFDKLSEDESKRALQKKKTRLYSMMIFLRNCAFPEIPMKGIAGGVAKVACFILHYLLKLVPDGNRRFYKKFDYYSQLANEENSTKLIMYQEPVSEKTIANIEEVAEIVDMPFENTTVKAYKTIDTLTRRYYGDYMQMPPEDKRVNHAAEVLEFGE